MKARVDLDSELTNRVADRSCDANRSGRAVERQEEASTRGVNLMSSKPCQLGANERMVALEQHTERRQAWLRASSTRRCP